MDYSNSVFLFSYRDRPTTYPELGFKKTEWELIRLNLGDQMV
jgi:hypothetical protein